MKYAGDRNVTVTGVPCLPWRLTVRPDIGPENHCRQSAMDRPWCYTLEAAKPDQERAWGWCYEHCPKQR